MKAKGWGEGREDKGGMMKGFYLLLAVSCRLSIASGQWLEKTVLLPDSCGGLIWPETAVWNTLQHRLFVTGGFADAVVAIDGGTNRRCARIPLPGGSHHVCFNPRSNKLYCTQDANVAVVDCARETVIANPAAGSIPMTLCFDSADNRIYCANNGSSNLTAIDGVTNSVVATIPVRANPQYLCYSPQSNRLYCTYSGDTRITVVNCLTNQVVKTITAPHNVTQLLYYPAGDKVYCIINQPECLGVIDCATDSLFRTVNTRGVPLGLGSNPGAGRVYASIWPESLAVIDAAADTLVKKFRIGVDGAICCDTANRRVFCLGSELATIDGWGDSLVAHRPIGVGLTDMCLGGGTRRLYFVDYARFSVHVFDTELDTLVATIPVGLFVWSLGYNPVDEKVYAPDFEYDQTAVIDAAAVRPIRVLQLPPGAHTMAVGCIPDQDKVYCGNDWGDTITVLDGATDSVIKRFKAEDGSNAFCRLPGTNKLYCLGSNMYAVSVVDCSADSMIDTVRVRENPVALCLNPAASKLYCANHGYAGQESTVSVIDCARDSVVATVRVGTGTCVLCPIAATNRVYCASEQADNISVIDCATDSVVRVIALNSTPTQLCYSSALNKVYCGTSDGCLKVIDTGTDSIVRVLGMPAACSRLCLDTVRNKVYAAFAGADSVVVIDAASDTCIAGIRVGDGPCDLVWSPSRSRVFVANRNSSSISVIRDSGFVGMETGGARAVRRAMPTGTVFRGTLFVPLSPGPDAGIEIVLLDVTGRKVARLRPGRNDVSNLSSGVYFVQSGQVHETAKVAIQR